MFNSRKEKIMGKTLRELWIDFSQGTEGYGRDFHVILVMVGLYGSSRFATTIDDLRREFGNGENLRDLYLPKNEDAEIISTICVVSNFEDLVRDDLLEFTMENSKVKFVIIHESGESTFTARLTRIQGKDVEFGERKFDPTLIKSWGDVIDLILFPKD